MGARGERTFGATTLLAMVISVTCGAVSGCDRRQAASADGAAAKSVPSILDLVPGVGAILSTDPAEDFGSGAPPV